MSSRRPFLLRTVRHLLRDLMALVRLGLTSRAHLAAENLFLRKQLALYQERRTKPRRSDFLSCHQPLVRPLPTGHSLPTGSRVIATPVLNGLHHEYQLASEAA